MDDNIVAAYFSYLFTEAAAIFSNTLPSPMATAGKLTNV